MNTPQRIDAQVATKAAEWLIRLEDTERPVTPRQQARFFAWLSRSPEHLKAFFDTAGLWQGLESFDPEQQIDIEKFLAQRLARTTSLTPVLAAPSSISASAPRGPARRPVWRNSWVVAAAVATIAIVLPLATWMVLHDRASTYHTAIGEQRVFRLADGSLLHLNTRSQAKVRFSDRERQIELLSGEALFTVERDANRPFLVHTQTAVIRAVGTEFNVYEHAGATTVSVVEGTVQVSSDATTNIDGEGPSTTLLAAGEQAQIGRGNITKRKVNEVASAVAWRERRLVFNNVPLAEVTAEFNRYNTVQIQAEEPLGRTKRLTGIFSADHPQSLILYLQREQALAVEKNGETFLVRARR